jgi:hypothetical protein
VRKFRSGRHGETDNKKRKQVVPESAYIHRLTDKYWRDVPVGPAPPIFVGVATSPMNIRGLYSSVSTYIRWFKVPMNILAPTNEPLFSIMGGARSCHVLPLFLLFLSLFGRDPLKFLLYRSTILAKVSPLLPYSFCLCPFFL